MDTKVIKINNENIHEAIEAARSILAAGGLVGIPTETVYGLGANALDATAVKSIFQAKGRPADNPLIVHIADMDKLPPLVASIPPAAVKLAEAFWPGPLTMIMPKSDIVPMETTAGLDTVAVRMPGNKTALALIRACGFPIAAPSANRSGRPSPTTAEHVFNDMNGRIPLILDAGPCSVGLESTVLDLTGEIPTVLRPGAVTPEQIAAITGQVTVHSAVLAPHEGKTPSPGMKYRHYAPRAAMTIINGEAEAVHRKIRELMSLSVSEGVRAAAICTDAKGKHEYAMGEGKDAAARIFALLRRLDELGYERIYVQAVPASGIGLALMNRLVRAAGFNIIQAD